MELNLNRVAVVDRRRNYISRGGGWEKREGAARKQRDYLMMSPLLNKSTFRHKNLKSKVGGILLCEP